MVEIEKNGIANCSVCGEKNLTGLVTHSCVGFLKDQLAEANKLLKFFRPSIIELDNGGASVTFKRHNRVQALKIEGYFKSF